MKTMITLSAKVLLLCLTVIQVEWAVGYLLNLGCSRIREFVDGHNKLRLQLAQGKVEGQPAATRMTTLMWDEELANKASDWASYEKFQQNPNHTIPSKRFDTGENLYRYRTMRPGFRSFKIETALQDWFNEHKNYTFKPLEQTDFLDGEPETAHYTQMAWADTYFVGCAISNSRKGKWYKIIVVCNYGPGGNYLDQTPYEAGEPSNELVCGTNDCRRLYGSRCF